MPDISRMVVPEFAASSGAPAARKPRTPQPSISNVSSPRRCTVAPSACRHARVAAQSAPDE
jgi:hypothetical protein